MIERSQAQLDPFLRCTHPALQAWVNEALEEAERRRWGSRRRRSADLAALREQSLIVLSNAAYALATGLEPPSVALLVGRPMRKRIARYEGPALGQIDGVLDALSPLLVTIERSRTQGTASMLLPSADLRRSLADLTDFDMRRSFRREGGETIILRRTERDARTKQRIGAELLDYAETDETRRLRAEMERINAGLEAADISLEGAPAGWEPGGRRLERKFIAAAGEAGGRDKPANLANGGRLWGGWWLNWPKERRGEIRIEGQPVADLDFRNMHLRLAYIEKGLEPPPGDLYAGILATPEDDAAYRAGVKQFVNAMLSRETALTRKPRDSGGGLPRGLSAAALREAVLRRHSAIADVFETGAAYRFQRAESYTMAAVLLKLLDRGIIALPIHDGLMARRDRAAEAAATMAEVSKAVRGHALEVRLAAAYG